VIKQKLSLEVSVGLLQMLRQELAQSVDPRVLAHWNRKISGGIVPTETLIKGEVDWAEHDEALSKLAQFEVDVVLSLCQNQWKPANSKELAKVKMVHYVGVGNAEALLRVADVLLVLNHVITAYDTSEVGVKNAEAALEKVFGKGKSLVFLADILSACQNKYISPKKGSKLILPRILDVLDTQELGWQEKLPRDRKMARTARRIGSLRPFLDVLLIHPCPEDNPGAIWGDTTPHALEEIKGYMEEGSRCELEFKKLGTHSFHGHVYTAVLIRPK
jgi:hypothetical protein